MEHSFRGLWRFTSARKNRLTKCLWNTYISVCKTLLEASNAYYPIHESRSHDVRLAVQERPGTPGRAGALLLLRSHINDRHRTFGERRCSICFPREHGGFSVRLHTRATYLPRIGPQETLLAAGFEHQPVGRVSLRGLSQASRSTGSRDANTHAGRDAKTLARRGIDEKRIVERFGSSWSEII